jgi:glycosyltransferase involved in cell wall biosynthesis
MKKLSIIIPVFNEEATIEEIMRRVDKAVTPFCEKEIIVVNDGSDDKTAELLKKIRKEIDFILIEHYRNQGKGKAIKSGLKRAKGELVFIQDADLEYDPRDYPILLRSWSRQNPVVYGQRQIGGKPWIWHYSLWPSKPLTVFINLLSGSRLNDAYTGYKLFPAALAKSLNLESSGFEFEAELTIKILKRGIKIKETPVHYYPRRFKAGKKIRLKDAFLGLWAIIKYSFSR